MLPKFLLCITFFLYLFFVFFTDVALFALDFRYTNCSSAFDCGPIKGIGYPFWGGSRPDYCGHPGYFLECHNGVTELEIMSLKYEVLNIDQETQILKIARSDFVDNPCTTNYNNSILDLSLFDYTPDSTNLTLFYVCPIRTANVDLSHKFTCGYGSESNAYFYANSSGGRSDCEWKMSVPIPQTAGVRLENGQSTVSNVLRNGFEARIVRNNSQCDECSKSGGRCGYDLDLDEFTCFCTDISHPRKCPLSPSSSARPPSGAKTKKIMLALLAGASGGAVGILAIYFFWRRIFFSRKLMVLLKKKTESAQNIEAFLVNYGSLSPRRYKYSEIKKMTNSFQHKLGQGGYGSVFKGMLRDGCIVAVKLLSESKGNGEEFINEVASISKTSHVNIVTLLGFCVEGTKRALIYEFMPNGSLEKFIYDKARPHLGWKTLYNIAVGIARGLEYLHRGCNTRILHFDIKPHNILLDLDFSPKIADFGLSKLCLAKESVVSWSGARGTPGFIAPELVSRNFGVVSHKSDVYSYGMMVLEMVGGRKNVDDRADNTSEIYFPEWIYNRLDQSVDFGLQLGVLTREDEEIAQKMVLVGLWCIQTNPSNRPPINKVLEMLEGSLEELKIPPKPFFSP